MLKIFHRFFLNSIISSSFFCSNWFALFFFASENLIMTSFLLKYPFLTVSFNTGQTIFVCSHYHNFPPVCQRTRPVSRANQAVTKGLKSPWSPFLKTSWSNNTMRLSKVKKRQGGKQEIMLSQEIVVIK
uniref:Uncharacterized protein n=1 Tax=Myotis myotis TaxID=51298 RepID=A0A7J7ZXI8_MYOMY|nr:hypothetical protein mMyoMyo1_009897 [Myotis myotis]